MKERMKMNRKACAAICAAAVLILIAAFFLYQLNQRRSKGTDRDGFYTGYVILTDHGAYFEAKYDSNFFDKGELVKINYQPDGVLIDFPEDEVSTGDEIRMEIHRGGDLLPPVAIVDGYEKISSGGADRIDPAVLEKLKELGCQVK